MTIKQTGNSRSGTALPEFREGIILLSLKTGSKTGTVELQQRIAREGIPVSLRSVQRQLNLLSTVLPIEGDGNSPQGWRWKADTAATVARVAGGAA